MDNDITKCTNEECRSKNSCYRYTCKPNKYRQSYSLFSESECECFIKDKEEK